MTNLKIPCFFFKKSIYPQLLPPSSQIWIFSEIAHSGAEFQAILLHKLNDPRSSQNIFWKILKTFYNGNKTPLIPPIIIKDKLVSDYEEKANHFNIFFASQSTPIDNDSQTPYSVVFSTEAKFSSITCEDSDILKIIGNSDISKAHGFDHISKRMVKLCYDSLVKPSSIIFHGLVLIQNCINSGVFPDSWKNQTLSELTRKMTKT